MQKEKPRALRLADWCEENSSGIYRPSAEAADELRLQYARIAELEAQVKQLQREPLSCDVRRKVFDDLYPHGALPQTFENFKIISRAIEAAHNIK